MSLFKISPCVALATIAILVTRISSAATYYVDTELGNDSYTGTSASPASTSGPWQTLTRLTTAQLLPGDQVLLRCGQIWKEGLKLRSSGTPTAPIAIGTYPGNCSSPPTIDGTAQIPWHDWSSSGAEASFKAIYPANLLRNGDFSLGTTAWYRWSSDNKMTLNATSSGCQNGAAPCLAIGEGSTSTFGIASSYSFEVEATRKYKLAFDINIPTGSTIRTLVRRAANPWEMIGSASTITGTGSWQRIELSIQSTSSTKEARLDFEIKGNTPVKIDNVSLQPALGQPIGLFVEDTPHVIARHPNPRKSLSAPQSSYISLKQNGDTVTQSGKTGSSYLPLDRTDPTVPTNDQLLAPGVSIFYRPVPWILERRKVKGISGNLILLDAISSSPLRAGYGYFFTGAKWMVDEAGEWLHDPLDGSIYLRPHDGASPGHRVSVAHVTTGIDASGLSDININGIAVRRTGTGIDISATNRVRIQDCTIQQTIGEGILAYASRDALIDSNITFNTGGDAIRGTTNGFATASGLSVTGNKIHNSGVFADDGNIISTPVPSAGAINGGIRATVKGNEISHTSYHGITVLAESTVQNNSISRACAVLDDCGGIYVVEKDHNSVIQWNVIRDLTGNIEGRPGDWPHTVGIYLDELSSGITVSNNTIQNSEYGIQLHNAARNTIQNNTIYGNRRYQLWLQEGTKILDPLGDLSGNLIDSNRIFPTGTSLGIIQESSITNTYRFARYDQNVYSGLMSRQVARESWSGSEKAHSFSEWQNATALGIPRNLDPNGRQVTLAGYTNFQVAGTSLIAEINPLLDVSGWRPWNATAPKATATIEDCSGTPCVTLKAGGSSSLLSTPHFSVEAGKWYRITFDLRTPLENQKVTLSPRRGGGGTNGYELFVDSQAVFYGSTAWRRHTLIVQSRLTINSNDPTTGDYGARLDFQNIPIGQQISLANVEVIQLRPVGTELRTNLLANGSETSISSTCPDEEVAPDSCDQYITFPEKTKISWPHTVDAYSSEIIYTQDSTLVDSDGDGIADIEDECPNTKDGAGTNSRGCGI